MITQLQRNHIAQLATDHGEEYSLRELADTVGVTRERVRQILAELGIKKARKLGKLHDCKHDGCTRKFRGATGYSGVNATYCHQHRTRRTND